MTEPTEPLDQERAGVVGMMALDAMACLMAARAFLRALQPAATNGLPDDFVGLSLCENCPGRIGKHEHRFPHVNDINVSVRGTAAARYAEAARRSLAPLPYPLTELVNYPLVNPVRS